MADPVVTIPNLPSGAMVDKEGFPTTEELNFRQALITLLQRLIGSEGTVLPTQNATNIAIIQNNTVPVYTNPPSTAYTCQYGTSLYDSTDNIIYIAVNNGYGAPLFKEVVLLDTQTLEPTAGAIAGYVDVTFLGNPYKIALYAP